MRVQAFVSPLFAEHEAASRHPERPARYEAVLTGISESSVAADVVRREARAATDDELRRVHTEGHLVTVQRTAGKVGHLDADTFYNAYSCAAAQHAAGAACQLVESLFAGETDYGIVACRPPGHHATASHAMGFCLLNSAAVAARAAQALGLPRVAIIDWDVHHGNGTEAIFYDDPSVLYVSTHQSPQYPGTGDVSDVGGPNALGKNINIPLSAGADDAVYGEAFARVIVPILEQFDPSLVLVSAGYDAHLRDPLGGMELTDGGFGHLTRLVMSRLPNLGCGRLGFLLEGGYDLTALTRSVDATLSALASPALLAVTPGPVDGAYRAQIDWAEQVQSEYWQLSEKLG